MLRGLLELAEKPIQTGTGKNKATVLANIPLMPLPELERRMSRARCAASTRAGSGASSAAPGRPTTAASGRAFLVASVGLVRAAFRMSWPRTLVGAWLVLRANMVWAPFPDNDPDAARALMRRFYQLLRMSESAALRSRPGRAARGGVVACPPRAPARGRRATPRAGLIHGPARPLRLHVRGRPRRRGAPAAALRAEAMDVSDRWVEAGSDPADPLLAQERALLVRSYAAAAGGRAIA